MPGIPLAVNQADDFRPVEHTTDKVKQVFLVGVRRVTPDDADSRLDIVVLAVEFYPDVLGAIFLDSTTRGDGSLVTHKEHLITLFCSSMAFR